MTKTARNKGPWTHRFLTILFSAIFALLCFWLIGFLVNDIGAWPGPDYKELEQRRLNQETVEEAAKLDQEISDAERMVADQKAQQELLRRQHC